MFVCHIVSELRFYGCCHPCLKRCSQGFLRAVRETLLENFTPPLNKNVEWWWSFMPSPMTSWALASLGFAIAVSIGLWQLRKPVKEDY